ncbi:MAG: DUF721 domain-containing protein [Bacteroidia bacterium]
MKKNNLISIGDAISKILKDEKLDVKLSRYSVKKNWEDIVGKMVKNHTTAIQFDDYGVMYISIDSPVLRTEIIYRMESLRNKINSYCGYELVKKLIIK